MIVMNENDKDIFRMIRYIGGDYSKALYIYLDALRYGINNKEVKSWIQYNGFEIESVCLKYYTGMHFYSKGSFDNASEYLDILERESPNVICGENRIIQILNYHLKGYSYESGKVARYTGYKSKYDDINIQAAGRNDYPKMAELLLEDELWAGYTKETLISQMEERILGGYSRSYCLYEGDVLVAQVSTGAEETNIATITYVLTNKEYRGRGIAKKMVAYISEKLENEGFETFLVYYDSRVGNLYKHVGYEDVCDWGKLAKEV